MTDKEAKEFNKELARIADLGFEAFEENVKDVDNAKDIEFVWNSIQVYLAWIREDSTDKNIQNLLASIFSVGYGLAIDRLGAKDDGNKELA